MPRIAYCTNVHAGSNLSETRENLNRFAVTVKSQFSPDQVMGVGLWLSDQTSAALADNQAGMDEFAQFLRNAGLSPFTFNGFPFGNFHQKVVKKDVYLPTWFESDRLDYTIRLANLISYFSDATQLSISTLPLAWGNPTPKCESLIAAAEQLATLAYRLDGIRSETGRTITICIEPEPGCYLQYSEDVIRFFEDYLFKNGNEQILRRHIQVCHDVCHAVVMCESQHDVFARYQAAGIEVGKVQISSAVIIDFEKLSGDERDEALRQLASFAEDRYLHQTTIELDDGTHQFFEDLPVALAVVDESNPPKGIWRIHFHVPVYLSKFGLLSASQQDIVECVTSCRKFSQVDHFEVETYAWNVLPPELREDDLAIGIANELKWFSELAEKHSL